MPPSDAPRCSRERLAITPCCYHREHQLAVGIDRGQCESILGRKPETGYVGVVDALDQHDVVDAVLLALPVVANLLGSICRECVAVKPGKMADIHRVLDMLEPVGMDRLDLDSLDPVGAHVEHVVLGQKRGRIGAQIPKDDAAVFLGPVRPELDAISEAGRLRLGRLLQAVTRPIVEPAMIRAAQAVTFHPPEIEGHAAVCAAELQQARLAAGPAIQHQIFA